MTQWLPSVVAVHLVLVLVAALSVVSIAGRDAPPELAADAAASADVAWADHAAAEPVQQAETTEYGDQTDTPGLEPEHTADLAEEAEVAQDEPEAAIPQAPEPEATQRAPPPPEPDVSAASAGGSVEDVFAQEFPAHAAARQSDDPATQHWAVLVGVNRYQGRTQDTLGSVADALAMRQILLDRGWRDDHILVLTDHAATHDRIVRAIDWLARSTDERSTVVFSFSGHLRHRNGVTAVWPTDNRFIWADEFGRLMSRIEAGRMWVAMQGCHAAGLKAPGLEGPGRIVTYSSRTAEKSYEDPEVGHSVLGYYVFVEGFHQGWGDGNEDGQVSVQEAFEWGAPRANIRTARQQTPVIADGLGEPLHLEVEGQA